MESTAQYWKPVWLDLEPHFPKLHLARAQSNRAPKGRKNDFPDAKRLARRLLAGELMLSYVPEPEQRAWRMMTRGRLQLVRVRVGVQNKVEALLEEMRIKQWKAHSGSFLARPNRSGETGQTWGRPAEVHQRAVSGRIAGLAGGSPSGDSEAGCQK